MTFLSWFFYSFLPYLFLWSLVSYLTISNLMFQLALFILVAGILCIYINYDCDRQRQEFRRTNGKCLVWGKAPSKVFSLVKIIMRLLLYVQFEIYWLKKKNDLYISDCRFIHYHIWRNKDKPSFNLRMVSTLVLCGKYEIVHTHITEFLCRCFLLHMES